MENKRNTKLSEQFQNTRQKYQAVGTVSKYKKEIPSCRNSFKIQERNTKLSEQFQNTRKKYQAVGTVSKYKKEIIGRDKIDNPNTQIHDL
jgi:ribosome-associated toxin RatA of RatAB toxin-antitoxin module